MKEARKPGGAAREPGSARTRKGKIRICLVDDHPLLRSGIAQRIRTERDLTVVCQAGNADDAIRALEGKRCDLAVVDIELPGGNGFDLLDRLRQLYPDMGIVMLSMHDESRYAERATQTGAGGYVSKASPPVELITAIRTVARGGQYISVDIRERLSAARPAASAGLPLRPTRVNQLCGREREVFLLIAQAHTTREIAEALGLSINTVDSYRTNIKRKLGLRNTTELVLRAAEFARGEPPPADAPGEPAAPAPP